MPTKIISAINLTEPCQSKVEAFSTDTEPFSIAKLLSTKVGTIDDDVSASIDEPYSGEQEASAQLDFQSLILSADLVQYGNLPPQPPAELPLQLLGVNSDSDSEMNSIPIEPDDKVTDNLSDNIAK